MPSTFEISCMCHENALYKKNIPTESTKTSKDGLSAYGENKENTKL